MSFSITPSDAVRKHPTNTSTSKEIHIFSKSKRFIPPNPECPTAFYAYDSQLSDRKAGFGYGTKSDFTRTLTVSPPATKYELKTFVEDTKSKGKSFGLDRQKLPNNSYLIPQMQKVPGPGVVQSIIFSMRMRNKKWKIIVLLCGQNQLILLRKNFPTKIHLDQVLIKTLT
jgi:hypothetical protein